MDNMGNGSSYGEKIFSSIDCLNSISYVIIKVEEMICIPPHVIIQWNPRLDTRHFNKFLPIREYVLDITIFPSG